MIWKKIAVSEYYQKARSGFKYWYDDPIGMGTKKES